MNDPIPAYPTGIESEKLSELPKEVLDAVFEAAAEEVGYARLNEAWAILIIANLRTLNLLEHLLGQQVTFETDITLNPPITMHERELFDDAAREKGRHRVFPFFISRVRF